MKTPTSFLILVLCALPALARATVSIEFSFGQVSEPAGTVGVLVADANGNGFTSPADATGTTLRAGESFGSGDDIIIAAVQADEGAHWDGEAGFSELLDSIDYASLGINAGTPLIFYWFPNHQSLGGTLANGDSWKGFREASPANGGGTIGFILPEDWGTYRISQLASALGGDFNPSDPASSGDFSEGLVGEEPLAPTNLTATDGLHPDKVTITWNSAADATSYDLYRNTVDNFGTATRIGNTTMTSFEDTTGTYGVTYYYWVVALNGVIVGAESASDAGSRSLGIPGNFSASDGTSSSGVELSWDAVDGAESYDLYRNTTPEFGSATVIGSTINLNITDAGAVAGVLYYYWIVAKNSEGTGAPTTVSTGSKALASISDLIVQRLSGRVRLSWSAVPEALRYRIYRSSTGDFSDAVLLDTVTSTLFEDSSSAYGADYTYWVEGENDQTAAERVSIIGGEGRLLPDLAIGLKTSKLKGDNVYNPSGSGQVLKATTTGKKVRTVLQLQNDESAPDSVRLAVSGGNSYYTYKVIRLSGGSANITSAAKVGAYVSSPLSGGAAELIRFEVKPKRSKLRDKSKRFNAKISAFSSTEASLSDVNQLKVAYKKK